MIEILLDELPGDEEISVISQWYVEEGDSVF